MTNTQQDVEEFGHYFLDLTRLHLDPEQFPFYDLMHVTRTDDVADQRRFHKVPVFRDNLAKESVEFVDFKLQSFFDVTFPYEKLLKSVLADEKFDGAEMPEFKLTQRLHEALERPETAVFGTVDRLVTFPRYIFFKVARKTASNLLCSQFEKLFQVSRHGHTQNGKPCKFPYALKVDPEIDLASMAATNVTDTDLEGNLKISGYVEQRVASQSAAKPVKATVDPALKQLLDFGVDEKT